MYVNLIEIDNKKVDNYVGNINLEESELYKFLTHCKSDSDDCKKEKHAALMMTKYFKVIFDRFGVFL